MKPRLFIHNPYATPDFGRQITYLLNASGDISKYGYLARELVNHHSDKIEVIFLLNTSRHKGFIKTITWKIVATAKLYIWAQLNRINLFKVRVTTDPSTIREQDVFFSTCRTGLKHDPVTFMKDCPCRKLFHLSHYFLNTRLVAKNAKEIGVDHFISENNLSKNGEYFKHYFPFYTNDVYVMPFVFKSNIFARKTDIKERKNICFVSGRVVIVDEHDLSHKDYFEFFGYVRCYHRMREQIFLNSETLRANIDSYINTENTSKDTPEQRAIRLTGWKMKLKALSARILSAKFNRKEYNYYSRFDIVDKFNEYRMFVAPEEYVDVPTITFVEGMACGCAYFGKRDPMYEDIGLIDGIHYVGYNGDLDDLTEKIAYYQNHADDLERIADNGYRFVRSNFNEQVSGDKFVADLLGMCNGKDGYGETPALKSSHLKL